jgi:hypothetical protein
MEAPSGRFYTHLEACLSIGVNQALADDNPMVHRAAVDSAPCGHLAALFIVSGASITCGSVSSEKECPSLVESATVTAYSARGSDACTARQNCHHLREPSNGAHMEVRPFATVR